MTYPGTNPRHDLQQVISIYPQLKGKPFFPSLRVLRLEQGHWPLTPTEASLLFSCTLETLRIIYRPQTHIQRKVPWGGHTAWQFCYLKLAERSPNLSTCCIIVTGACLHCPDDVPWAATTSVITIKPNQKANQFFCSIPPAQDSDSHDGADSLTFSIKLLTVLPVHSAQQLQNKNNNKLTGCVAILRYCCSD